MGGVKRIAEAVASELGILDPNDNRVVMETQRRIDRAQYFWRKHMRRQRILSYEGFETEIEDRIDRERRGK